MFGIGGFELFIILIFGFLIFGPDKLPDIAKTVGKGIARFREAQQEVNDAIGDEKLIDFDDPDQPIKDPMETLDRIAKRHEEKKAGESKAADSPSASDSAGEDVDEKPKQESFTERKARYERERAARKAAEAEAATISENPVGAASCRPSGELEKRSGTAPAEAPAADELAEGGDA